MGAIIRHPPPTHSQHRPSGEPKLPPQPAATRSTSLPGVGGGETENLDSHPHRAAVR